jgi:hypothetical protein
VKQYFLLLGVVIGFALIGCDNDTNKTEEISFEGTWLGTFPNDFIAVELREKSVEMIFSENSWLQKIEEENYAKGTFRYDSVNFYHTLTHLYSNDSWIDVSGINSDENIEYNIKGDTLTFTNAAQVSFSLKKIK